MKQHLALFLDFSKILDSQIAAAAAWVGNQEATISVFHSYNPTPGYMGTGSRGSEISIEEMDCRLQDAVKQIDELTHHNCYVDGTLLQGDPVEKIPAEINLLKPDLVVFGAHGHGRVRDLFVGSVLQAAIKHTEARLLIVPYEHHVEADNGFKNVLCATDLSQASDKIIAAAAYAAKQVGDKLTLAHVVIPPSTVVEGVAVESFGPVIIQQRTDSANAQLKEQVDALKQDLPDTIISQHVQVGPAAQAIDSMATDLDADLLVIGSHGHGIIYGMMIGSTTQHLLYHCRRPMLVVPV